MIKIRVKQFIAQVFMATKDTKDTLTKVSYNVTISVGEAEHHMLMEMIGVFHPQAGEKMQERLDIIKADDKKSGKDEITGDYQYESYGDNSSFTGMLINGHQFPHGMKGATKMVILQDVDCLCDVRVMKKKDGSTQFIVEPKIVNQAGATSEDTKKKK